MHVWSKAELEWSVWSRQLVETESKFRFAFDYENMEKGIAAEQDSDGNVKGEK